MIHREYHNVYSEVDGLSTLLGYKTSNAGCCKARAADLGRSSALNTQLILLASDLPGVSRLKSRCNLVA
jgi:hypothetical protein